MKANVLNQERASLLNILTRSDTLRPSPGLEMTASIRRLADERKVQIISCSNTKQYIPRFSKLRMIGNFLNFSLVMWSSLMVA